MIKEAGEILNTLGKYTAICMEGSKHRGNRTFLICFMFFKCLTVRHKPSESQSADTLFSLFEMLIVKLPEMQSNGDRIML